MMHDGQTTQAPLQAKPSGSPRAQAQVMPKEKISLDEAKDALLRSGYLLETRLETLLSKRAYFVEANGAYPDPETGKSREFDLYAMGAHRAGPEELDFIFTILLLECINNPQPLVFLTKTSQIGFLHHEDAKMAGLPLKFPDKKHRNEWESISDFLRMSTYHHYCRGRVATQFCSFVKKKNSQEWMATHDEEHFDALKNALRRNGARSQ